MDITTLSLAKKYANKIAAGITAARVEGSSIILTLVDGTEAICQLPAPKDGISVIDLSIDTDGSLLCHMSDGTTIDAGYVPTVDPDLTNYYTKEEIDKELNNIKLDNITPVYCLKLSSTTNILEVNRTIISTVESELQEISKIITDAFSRKGFMLYVATTVTSSYVRNPAEFYVYTDLSTHPTKIYGDGQKIYHDINDKYATYLAAAIVITGTWVDDVFTATEIYIGGSSSPAHLTLDTNVLTRDNTSSFTPTANYHPATKKYVDDSIIATITDALGGSY